MAKGTIKGWLHESLGVKCGEGILPIIGTLLLIKENKLIIEYIIRFLTTRLSCKPFFR